MTDFYWIALAALFFSGMKKLFNILFFKPFYKRLQLKKLHDEHVVKLKLTKNFFDGCWYLAMFLLGLAVANGDPNMPFFYLGSGSWDSLGNNWP